MLRPVMLTALSIITALTAVRISSNAITQSRMKQEGLTKDDVYGPYERRFMHLRDNLPEMAREAGDKSLYLGSSLWHLFLDPGTDGYNLSFAGMIGQPLYLLTARLNSELKGRPKFDKIFLEFSPASYSWRAFSHAGFHINYVYGDSFPNTQVWKTILIHDPAEALPLLLRRLIRPFTRWNLPGLRALEADSRAVISKTMQHAKRPLRWEDPVFREKPEWNLAARGAFNWNLPTARAEYLEALEEERRNWEAQVLVYVRRHGLFPGFGLHEGSFRMFLKAAAEAKSIAQEVHVLIPPYSPALQRAADRHINYPAIVARLCRAGGFAVHDLHRAIPTDDRGFADPMHAHRRTINRYLQAARARVAAGENDCGPLGTHSAQSSGNEN